MVTNANEQRTYGFVQSNSINTDILLFVAGVCLFFHIMENFLCQMVLNTHSRLIRNPIQLFHVHTPFFFDGVQIWLFPIILSLIYGIVYTDSNSSGSLFLSFLEDGGSIDHP